MCSAAGRGRWPVARPSGTPRGRRAPDGAPGQTPATAAGTQCWRHVAAATRCARPVGHASGRTHHAQGGWELVRGVVSPRSTTSAVPGGGTSGRPQRVRRAATGGWCGRGVGASGCPRAADHGGGRASPHRIGSLRVCHPGRGRHVAVRPRARPGGPAGGVGVPEAGRRPQRATPARCAGGAASLAARRAQRLGCAVSHGRWSGGGPGPRGRGGVRRPARTVAWSSCLGVRHTATVPPGACHHLGRLPGCGAPSAQPPSRCAGAGQEGRQTGGHLAGSVSCPCGP